MSSGSQSRAHRRPPMVPVLLSLMLTLGMVLGLPVRAAADGPTTFSNTASIAIPSATSTSQSGPASPYPSNIAVSGMSGAVTKVTVSFNNLTHSIANDIDAMVVAPGGRNLLVMSDGASTGTFTFASNATLTFDDAATNQLPQSGAIATGNYRPTNRSLGAADAFPAPAPMPSTDTTLAEAFTGLASANGTWSLYVVDDTTGDLGTMAGGWTVTITTEIAAAGTTTMVNSSDSTSTTGQSVTLTATVRAGATVVTVGTVQFSSDGISLGSAVPLTASGNASLNTSALAEGTHLIRATYSGATGLLTSNGTLTQQVDNATTVNGNTFCNTGQITVPDSGTATPYPSNIFVTDLPGQITKVTASLKGVTHQASIDLDVLLSGPTPAQNLFLLSDAGGNDTPVTNADLTFDDSAANLVPSPIVSGTFRPTRVVDETGDPMPDPAPAPSSATALSTFNGGSANGTWSLWVRDDASGDVGSISGGWCVTITAEEETETALTSSLNPSTFGDAVTLSAGVTAAGDPVTAGSVQFSDGGTNLGTPVPVDGSGVASYRTSSLTVGSHRIEAAFVGTEGFGESDATLTQVVDLGVTETTLTSNNNPSEVGESVTFTATVTDADGDPLTSGSVQFSDGGTALGSPVPLAAGGTAPYTTATLTAGTHPITATFVQTPQYAESSDELNQVVDRILTETVLTSDNNPSEVGESVTFTATVTDADGDPLTSGSVQFSDGGTALGSPVPLAAGGTAPYTTATLTAGTHPITATFVQTPQYAESTSLAVNQGVGLVPTTTTLTSTPNPSDVNGPVTFTATVTVTEGGAPVTSETVEFRDDGALLGTGTLGPSGTATFTTASLAAGPHTITATFVATAQHETSSDDHDHVVERIVTITALQSAPNPSDPGDSVTFTAIVTNPAGSPVTTGSIAFTIDGVPIPGGPVPVNTSGIASFANAELDPGAYAVVATYVQNDTYAGSAATVNHIVRPVADAHGPYTVVEGGSLTLDATGSTDGATYTWDVDGDRDFTDAAGVAPTLTWAQLEPLGVDDGPSTSTVTLRVTLDGGTTDSEAELTVTNAAPIAVLSGSLTATVGVPYTIKVGADDPSSADMGAPFTYTVDWGDGSPIVRVVGPADPPVTHTYTAPGDYAASFTATDKDGGSGAPTSVTIRAGEAPIVTPSPTPTTTTSDPDYSDDDTDYSDSDDGSDSDLASTGSAVGPGTILLGLALLIGGGGVLLVSRRRRLGGPRHGE